MVFLEEEEGCAGVYAGFEDGRCGPEDIVVVGEVGEEDAEKEAGCWMLLVE